MLDNWDIVFYSGFSLIRESYNSDLSLLDYSVSKELYKLLGIFSKFFSFNFLGYACYSSLLFILLKFY